MKLIKFNFLINPFLSIFFISIISSFLIINFTSERYEKNLTFVVNEFSIPLNYIKREFGFNLYLDPLIYVSNLDVKLQSNDTVCSNIGVIKKVLPISFSLVKNKVNVKIISDNKKNINDCKNLIISEMNNYNIEMKRNFIEEFKFEDQILKKSSKKLPLTENEANILDKLILNIVNQYLNESANSNLAIDNNFEIIAKNLEIIESIKQIENTLLIKNRKLTEKEFTNVINQIKVISLENDYTEEFPKPNVYIIIISLFTILLFLYLIFFHLRKKKITLKNFKKLFN